MGWFDWATGKQSELTSDVEEQLAGSIASIDIKESAFTTAYMSMIYTKIMHECADRAAIPTGVDKSAYTATVHDSYSPFKRGLVSLLVVGMTEQNLKYYLISETKDGAKLFKDIPKSEATDENGSIKPGVLELDFREFAEGEVLKLLFSLLGGILQAMSNGVTISQAILLKIHALSEMMANQQNTEPLKHQLRQLTEALLQGKPGVVDAKSSLEFPTYDATPAQEASSYVFTLISSLTGLPASYLFGEVVGGLGDNSDSDENRMDAAIRRYFHAIYAPALKAVFLKAFEYKMLIAASADLVSFLAWVESTQLLTEEGKKRIILNNTPLTEGDIDVTYKEPKQTDGVNDNVVS